MAIRDRIVGMGPEPLHAGKQDELEGFDGDMQRVTVQIPTPVSSCRHHGQFCAPARLNKHLDKLQLSGKATIGDLHAIYRR